MEGSDVKTIADVGRHFYKHFNGQRNFFTPTVLGYGFGGDHLEWELSKGEIFGGDIFGVTVIRFEQGRSESAHDKCKSFKTQLEATKYIETLGK